MKKYCLHTRCDRKSTTIQIVDDHDSNAGMYYVHGYCSLECFVCELTHALENEDTRKIVNILKTIES